MCVCLGVCVCAVFSALRSFCACLLCVSGCPSEPSDVYWCAQPETTHRSHRLCSLSVLSVSALWFLFWIFALTCVIQCSVVRTETECVARVLTMDALAQVREAAVLCAF